MNGAILLGRRLPRLALLPPLAFCLFACGKRGDPLPPLRRTPQPVTAFTVAQRGDRLEIAYVAPRATTDGARLPILDVQILRADRPGDLERVARMEVRKAAPGEALFDVEPLPPPGTTLRFAARASSEGHLSGLTPVVTLHVQPPPPIPMDFGLEQSAEHVTLHWTGEVPVMPSPSPPPSPLSATRRPPTGSSTGRPTSGHPSPHASPVPPPGAAASPTPPAATAPPNAPPSPVATPAPSPSTSAPAPSGTASPTPAATTPATASPSPSPSPTPPPPPSRGFFVYRRAKDGEYLKPVTPYPVPGAPFEDATAQTGQAWCYVVRTVVSTDPLIEGPRSAEECLDVKDLVPPAAPVGFAAILRDDLVELSWSASPETDLAHYRVYRATPGGAPERIAELGVGETTYRDRQLVRGTVYFYTVTAVDRTGNESPPSAAVEGSLQ